MSGRKLRLKDIVVFDICAIASFRWIAPAAQAGPVSLLLFVVAAGVFFLPSGVVVARLSQLFPEDGGLYAWTRHAFGSRQAFLCSWFYFISNLFYFPSLVLFAVSNAAFIFGLNPTSFAEKPGYAIATTLLVLWFLFLANFLGLSVARWIQTLGSVAIVAVVTLLGVFAFVAVRHASPATAFEVRPSFDWQSLNLFSVIAFAFVGLELAPILGGGIEDPGRDIPRAAVIAGMACLLFYLVGTGALLALLRSDLVSPITGLAQAGSAAQRSLNIRGITRCFAALITIGVAAQLATWISGNTRLPYVIGLAHYLPTAFARLHPRWGTPYISLLLQAAVATVILLMAQMGETVRAAYLIMLDMLVVATFVPFLYIFASGWRFANRLASLFGLAVTVLAIGL
ncbi:MAG: APC family permease, partial [Acidobacteriaceae bacterium]|nr:APC family permease [Acidobacteriaceae bacterium]